MARQVGPIRFTGTMGGLTGYQVNGEHYVKKKNTAPSKHRFRHSPEYSNTRRNSDWFTQAQGLARKAYQTLPFDKRSQWKVWYPLRNRAQELVRQGREREAILRELREVTLPLLVEKAFPVKHIVQQVAALPEPSKPVTAASADTIELGRYYGRVDNMKLMDELSAARALIRSLVNSEEQQRSSLAMVEYKGLRETRRR